MLIRLKEVICSEKITHLIKSTPVNLPRYSIITGVEAEVSGLEGEIAAGQGTVLCHGRVELTIEGIVGECEGAQGVEKDAGGGIKAAARCSEAFELVKAVREAAGIDSPMLDLRAEVADVFLKHDEKPDRLEIFCVVELRLVLFRFVMFETGQGVGQGTVLCPISGQDRGQDRGRFPVSTQDREPSPVLSGSCPNAGHRTVPCPVAVPCLVEEVVHEGRRSMEKRVELQLEGGIKVTDIRFKTEKSQAELVRDGLIIGGEINISIYYLSRAGAEMFAEHREAFSMLVPVDLDIDYENSGVDVEISPSCAGYLIGEDGKAELSLLIEALFKLVRRVEALLPLEAWHSDGVETEGDKARKVAGAVAGNMVPLLCDRVVEKRTIDLAVTLKKIVSIRKEMVTDIDISVTRLDVRRGKKNVLLSGDLLFTVFYRDESGSGRSVELKDEFDLLVNVGEEIAGSCSFLFKPSDIRAVIAEDGGGRKGVRISAVGSIEAVLYREELFGMHLT